MRICLLEGDMSRSGGTERMCAWLANQLCKDHDVSVLSLNMAQNDLFFSLNEKVTHRILPRVSGKFGIYRQIRWIHNYIRENHIDRVINVDTGMGLYGILGAKGTGARVITWEHGNFYNNWDSRWFVHLRRFAARHSDAMVVLTQQDRQNYISKICRCAPVYAIPNPAPTPCGTYDPQSKVILSVGHLLPNKGFHRVVELAQRLLKDRPDWSWIICGEGSERARLEQLIEEAGLGDRIRLPGRVKDMQTMYQSSAMVVLTSDMEGLPMVLLEARAYVRPMVAFDIMTGPAEIIDEGVNGFLVKLFDMDVMAQRIGMLMDDPCLCQRLSAGCHNGLERFSQEEVLKSWETLLKEI